MIKDLADLAEVSEPTFFNYFDSKLDMLVYFIQLWSIEMNSFAQSSELKCNSYIATIKDIFHKSSLQITSNPQLILEIIAFQAQGYNQNFILFLQLKMVLFSRYYRY